MIRYQTIRLKDYINISAILMFLVASSSCAVSHKFGPYKGKVVDADSGQAIEGAVVFMECNTISGNVGGANTHFADAAEVLTDENGEFYIELRVNTFKPGHLWSPYQDITIFKPGYGVFPGHKKAKADKIVRDTSSFIPENTYVKISLPKLKTMDERSKNLNSISIPFNAPNEKVKLLSKLKSYERIQLGFEP